MLDTQTDVTAGGQEDFLDSLRAEYQRITAEMRDITSKIDLSRGQAEQFAQRNAVVVGEVKKIEGSLEETPRTVMKEAYTEALNSQQRLMTIRSQMEKLQAQEATLRQTADTIKSVIDNMTNATATKAQNAAKTTLNAREMIIRIIDAQEEERDRLATQMHDGPAHSLTNFILQAEICQKLFDKNPGKAKDELTNLMAAAREAFQRVRDFIFDLRPMMLTDLGLVPTLKRYMEAYQNKTGIETEIVLNGRERRLESYLEVLIFRGVQELLVYARDNAGATNVKVTLELGDDRIRAIVEDNGRGLGTGQLRLTDANSKSLGLSTLQERIHLVGGTLQVDSVSGQGSRIEIEVPAGREVDAQPSVS
jgi:two-component system, NarL family, sensor histidine kinase DegS